MKSKEELPTANTDVTGGGANNSSSSNDGDGSGSTIIIDTSLTTGNTVIVSNTASNTVIVSNTASNTVIVSNTASNTVIVSNTASNTVSNTTIIDFVELGSASLLATTVTGPIGVFSLIGALGSVTVSSITVGGFGPGGTGETSGDNFVDAASSVGNETGVSGVDSTSEQAGFNMNGDGLAIGETVLVDGEVITNSGDLGGYGGGNDMGGGGDGGDGGGGYGGGGLEDGDYGEYTYFADVQ